MQQLLQLEPRRVPLVARHIGARPHDQVNTLQQARLASEYVPRQTLALITRDGQRDHAFADHEPEPAPGKTIRPRIHLEILASDPAFECRHGRKFSRLGQPVGARKRTRRYAADQTPRRARPLARRSRTTARPPRVFIRTRKPWVRLRRVVEGWYVRFMTVAYTESEKLAITTVNSLFCQSWRATASVEAVTITAVDNFH